VSAGFWDEDDRPARAERKGWRWWQVAVLGLLLLAAVVIIGAGLFPEKLVGGYTEWRLGQYRKDILSGKLTPEALGAELLARDDGLYLATRLSEDPDPRVRSAAIERFVAGTSPARRREPGDNYGGGLEVGAEEGLKRLFDDADPAVRRKAIRAASGIAAADRFEGLLLRILESGSVEERLIVSEYLAHWNGAAVRNTFADPRQPKEVRLAALASAERFGWVEVVKPEGEFVAAMERVAADADPDLRKAAQDALAHLPGH
jgi:hypothetical protein